MKGPIVKRILFLTLLWICLPYFLAGAKTLIWEKGGLTIQLKDHLKLPVMSWPMTLLEYQVDFSKAPVNPGEVVLIEKQTGIAIPYQLTEMVLSNGKVKSANLSFLSDLPSGSDKQFQLLLRQNAPAGLQQGKIQNPVTVTSQNQEIIISNGLISAKIPAPGSYKESLFLQIGKNGRWYGKSEMQNKVPLQKMIVSQLNAGNLLTSYLLKFEFAQGKSLEITLKLAAGMEFLEMEERMKGFKETDSLAWKIIWDQFNPEYRYCPNRPGAPSDKTKRGYESFTWELIGGSDGDPLAQKHPELPYDQKNLPNGKLPFKIAPYHNWMTWWRLPTAAFWNEKSNESAGIFIKDFEKWVDPAYPIWGSKDNLSVHFFHKNGFWWSFPLVEGQRSLGITLYAHQKDVETSNNTNQPQVYVDYLRRWYGWISLNKTKDWILDYPSGKPSHPAFFKSEKQEAKFNPKDLLPNLKRTVGQMADAGERSKGPTPVGTRSFYDNTAPLFENAESTLTEEEYRQARALFMFMTYVFMDETLMPMKNLLSGHPNFLADIKGVPGLAAFLFPDHPEAGIMADHFEKSIALNLRYHTRPDEPSWDAKGGRWTENLGTYTWAFLRPTLKTSLLLHHYYDGKNRILQPNISLYGDWLLNALTSPVDNQKGRRTYPPQGAHSRILMPSNLLYTLGQELYNYDPILAEHIFWVSSPEDNGFENRPDRPDSWDSPAKGLFTYPGGTNPRLKSAKYTGYGFNLRHNFGEKDEMYVHLQQIDEGPNYRWGRAAKGGNGVIYYYAGGKQYSHNGVEDVGDGPFGDTERCTNFGVKKEKGYRDIGDFRSVGPNDLTEPLYDFGFAQFASILAAKGAAPDYKSRSVLMSNDYILVFDDVKDNETEGRFSWFVGKEDEFPYIHQLKPGVKPKDAGITPSTSPYHKDATELATKGWYYDGKGDFLTLVTHKKNLSPVFIDGVYRIEKQEEGATEWAVRNDSPVKFSNVDFLFEGTAGLMKQSKDKNTFQAALFKGLQIGIPGITARFNAEPQYGGMSLQNSVNGFSGTVQVAENTVVRFFLKEAGKMAFWMDGKEIALKMDAQNSYSVTFPAGAHEWQWSATSVVPVAPEILHSVSGTSWCELTWTSVPGADYYSIEKSSDSGNTWMPAAKQIRETKYKISGLNSDKKVHIRIVAIGKGGASKPSGDYPVYASLLKPHSPEGLTAVKKGTSLQLNWGRILGADNYTLYKREKGTKNFKIVYNGPVTTFSAPLPSDRKIWEFCVTATNGNGESDKSSLADTDEGRLINWYPVPDEVFRRDTESQENGYDEYNHWIEQEMPVLKYPFQNTLK